MSWIPAGILQGILAGYSFGCEVIAVARRGLSSVHVAGLCCGSGRPQQSHAEDLLRESAHERKVARGQAGGHRGSAAHLNAGGAVCRRPQRFLRHGLQRGLSSSPACSDPPTLFSGLQDIFGAGKSICDMAWEEGSALDCTGGTHAIH